MVDEHIRRYTELTYIILENKFIYYTSPNDCNGNSIKGISDEDYDHDIKLAQDEFDSI
jgi:hypothetical protein